MVAPTDVFTALLLFQSYGFTVVAPTRETDAPTAETCAETNDRTPPLGERSTKRRGANNETSQQESSFLPAGAPASANCARGLERPCTTLTASQDSKPSSWGRGGL